jgi:hypothetical protein
LTLRHGAYSSRMTDPVMVELVEGLLADRPDLIDHPDTVYLWASATSKVLVLDVWLAEHGLHDGEGQIRSAQSALERWSRRAEALGARLGLDAVSRANLARARADAHHAALDIDALRERGREVIDARSGAPDGDGGSDGES